MLRAGLSRKLVSGEAVHDVVFTLLLMNKKLLISTSFFRIKPVSQLFTQKYLLSTLESFLQTENINLTGYWCFNTS